MQVPLRRQSLSWLEPIQKLGFAIIPSMLKPMEVGVLLEAFSRAELPRSRAGLRHAMKLPAVASLAQDPRLMKIARGTLGRDAFPFRATLFDKTAGANWLVPWHQDLTVCVQSRRDVPGYGPWTKKAGVWHVQPPASVLERMLSVRIHLDDCEESNGALRVLPGTHRLGRLTAVEIAEQERIATSVSCVVSPGGVVVMRPLLVHASSAASKATHRRVIHIDYASSPLDDGLHWATASST